MKAITIIMKKAEEFNSNDNMLGEIIQKQLSVKTIKYCYVHTCKHTHTHMKIQNNTISTRRVLYLHLFKMTFE